MKENYEKSFDFRIPRRMPAILRLDGRAFHSFTRRAGFKRPFDGIFIALMNATAKYLCEQVQTAVFAYIQSDEMSILLHDYTRLGTQQWFNGKVQKMTSVSAGLASVFFGSIYLQRMHYDKDLCKEVAYDIRDYLDAGEYPVFDSRVFVLPETDVCNYFIWRQKDWERNSLSMLARSLCSQKELDEKKREHLHQICFEHGKNWNDLSVDLRRGRAVYRATDGRWFVDSNIPIFTQDRGFVERHLKVDEEPEKVVSVKLPSFDEKDTVGKIIREFKEKRIEKLARGEK